MNDAFGRQTEVCNEYGVAPAIVDAAATLGVSGDLLEPCTVRPIHGLRHQPETGTSGWYLWIGDLSDDPKFFSPLHAGHLADTCPIAIPYLGFPPGWRFLISETHEDVWFDPALLTTRQGD